MREHIILLVILALFIFGAEQKIAQSSGNSDETQPQYQLDLIVTTAERESEEFFYTVDDLSAAELSERNMTTVAQLLDQMPGIRTKIARLGHGKYVFVRGFEQQHLLILVDGVPLYGPYDGLVELDHIPSDQIQSIRVVKGSSPAQYGPNALGGVIQIITKNSSASANRDLVAEFGENGTSNLRLRHSLQRGPVHIRLSGSLARSNAQRLSRDFREAEVPGLPDGQGLLHYEDGGWRDNSDYSKKATHAAINYAPSDRFCLSLTGSLVDNEWGVPPHPFYNPDQNKSRIRHWRFSQWQQGMASLNGAGRLMENLSFQAGAFLAQYDNTLDSYDDETYTFQEKGYAFHSTFDDHVLGTHFRLTGRVGSMGEVTLGGGLTHDVHRDTPDLGETTQEFLARTWWFSVEDRVRISERMAAVLGINYSLLDKRKAGILEEIGDDLTALNPHVSLACLTSRTSRIYFNLARSSRFPTMKQLYGQDGNPHLKAQRAHHIELGGEWAAAEAMRMRAALFLDRLRDLIENNYISRTGDNIARAQFWGGELILQSSPLSSLRLSLGYAYLRTKNKSAQRPGERLQYRPEHQLDWSLSADLPCEFKILLDGSAVSRQHYYDDFHQRRLSHLPAYAVGNLTLRRGFSFGLEPFLSITNILDTAYQHVYTSPAPGREIRCGARLRW